MVKIFISHTKKDKKFCDDFDRVVARVEFLVSAQNMKKLKYLLGNK
jgi:hypothetical protein